MSSAGHSLSMACGGSMPLTVVLVLPLDRAPFWMIVCFFRTVDAMKEAFRGRIGGLDWMKGRSRV